MFYFDINGIINNILELFLPVKPAFHNISACNTDVICLGVARNSLLTLYLKGLA